MERRHGNCRRQTVPGNRSAALEAAAARLATFQRLSWREALGSVLTAAGRLHQYRDLRTRMLHDALERRDGEDSAGNVCE